VQDIVDKVGEILGRPLEVEIDSSRVRPAQSEVERLVSDPTLAHELTGWRPQLDLHDGLARTIEWMEANQARYRTDHYVI